MEVRLLAAIGVLPAFALLWYAERFERRIREPFPRWRYRILIATGLAALPIGMIEFQLAVLGEGLIEPRRTLYDAFIVAAMSEEVMKFACLWGLTRAGLRPGSRYGAFVYSLHAAMGFAAVENVVALISTPTLAEMTNLLVLRSYLAIPTHLFAGGIVGYFWARRRFDDGGLRLPAGIGLAIVVHGSYNTMISSVDRMPEAWELMLNVYALGAMAIPLVGALVLHAFAFHLVALDRADGRIRPGDALQRRSSSFPQASG